MESIIYERIFCVPQKDIHNYFDNAKFKYVVLEFYENNKTYLLGEVKNNTFAQ